MKIAGLLVLSVAFIGCSDAPSMLANPPPEPDPTVKPEPEPEPDLVLEQRLMAVGDRFCSKPSVDLYPTTKVVVVMDYSGSMNQNDPQQLRIQAVEHLMNEAASSLWPMEFSLVTFSSDAADMIAFDGGFSRDPQVLQAALSEMYTQDSQGATNYQAALRLARTIIVRDQDRFGIDNARYGIVFVTDGRPNEPEQAGDTDALMALNRPKVRDLITGCDSDVAGSLANRIDFLDTYFLAVRPDALGEGLVRDMAEGSSTDPCGPDNWGHGRYTRVAAAVDLEIQIDPVMPSRETYVNQGNFGVVNHTMKVVLHEGEVVISPDSDADGLADFVEKRELMGPSDSSAFSADTNQDGISDLVAVYLALPPNEAIMGAPYLRPAAATELGAFNMLQPLGDVVASPSDLDGDGLTDAEEQLLGTDETDFDSDDDGLFDELELRFGLNPLVADADSDIDGDGRTARNEVMAGLNPFVAEPDAVVQALAQQRTLGEQSTIDLTDGQVRRCQDFRIENAVFVASDYIDQPALEFNLHEVWFIDEARGALSDGGHVLRRHLVQTTGADLIRSGDEYW